MSEKRDASVRVVKTLKNGTRILGLFNDEPNTMNEFMVPEAIQMNKDIGFLRAYADMHGYKIRSVKVPRVKS